ncbi:hypothetical protein, partial [Serratia marcescens]|uniref:hypothetical protein n=1 Tax=Serratia marcescens TaxID=615 RepID=UPI0019533678
SCALGEQRHSHRSHLEHSLSCLHCLCRHGSYAHIGEDSGWGRSGEKGKTMLTQIKGLHHVTSMAADARQNNDFFTHKL